MDCNCGGPGCSCGEDADEMYEALHAAYWSLINRRTAVTKMINKHKKDNNPVPQNLIDQKKAILAEIRDFLRG